MNKKSFLKGFTRNLIIVGLVSLFTDLSSQMVFPLIPLYLVTIGASAWVIGLVEGAAETTASLLKVFSGYWSDKIKKTETICSHRIRIINYYKTIVCLCIFMAISLICKNI